MKVTALEIRQQQFPLRFRGLDPAEVDKFLELVAGDMEDLIRENARLRDGLARKDQELQRMQQGEDELKKALTAIQQIREDWIGRAEKQAEQVVLESDTEGEAAAGRGRAPTRSRSSMTCKSSNGRGTSCVSDIRRIAGGAPPGARNDRGRARGIREIAYPHYWKPLRPRRDVSGTDRG